MVSQLQLILPKVVCTFVNVKVNNSRYYIIKKKETIFVLFKVVDLQNVVPKIVKEKREGNLFQIGCIELAQYEW